MRQPPDSRGSRVQRRQLLQAVFALVLAIGSFLLGQRSSAPHSHAARSAKLLPGSEDGGNGVAVGDAAQSIKVTSSVTVSNCPDLQVDLAYDVVATAARRIQDPKFNESWVPLRRPGFQPPNNPDQQALYDKMWTGDDSYKKSSCWGCRFVGDVVARLDFDTVLDAGTGNGGIVRAMQLRGKSALGIELSQAVLERDAMDLLKAGRVEQGSLTDLPYQDKQFDVVFSSDVLEHILPEQADAVVSELVRVAKRHIVLSISLKSYENVKLHSLLRPRHWWEAKFEQHGVKTNRALVWALQQKENRFRRANDEFFQCRMEGSDVDGGKYEVCVVSTPWLVGRPGQELRKHRCITPSNLEMEPWIFAFTVD